MDSLVKIGERFGLGKCMSKYCHGTSEMSNCQDTANDDFMKGIDLCKELHAIPKHMN